MASILRSILPASALKNDEVCHDEDYSVEYSFAVEYSGPPVNYDIPQVVPVDIDHIPTAAAVAEANTLNNLSLPVIQPIAKCGHSYKVFLEMSNLGSEEENALPSATHSGEFEGSRRKLLRNESDKEDAVCLIDGDGCESKVSDNTGSSGTLGFSDSCEESNVASESSDMEDMNDNCEEGAKIGNCRSITDSDVEESSLRLQNLVSEISYVEEVEAEDSTLQAASQVNRTTAVTFRDIESSDTASEHRYHDEQGISVERPIARSDLRRGSCHRCLKANRLIQKEICLVCGAKYCRKCVLRAMGSMPEGRKCVTCIGFRIDESKRDSLGKCSKMLKGLLSAWQVNQIMSSEVLCEANWLPPHLVCVNGRPLSLEELVLLQSCSNPPKKLKPGKYWYDKVSGFWGKEGHRPCQIISPHLTVGDIIKRNASNGKTNIMINNREITKAESWMLQLAGINCEGNPHFWVSADGSCQHEGQKNVLGKIWDKTGIKLACAALSLPMPPETANSCNEEVANEATVAGSKDQCHKSLNKILVVGCDHSGATTIFKQAKILYKVPFSEDERQSVKCMIQGNLYRYIAIVLEGRERFEEEYMINFRRKLDQPSTSNAGSSLQMDEENIYSLSPRLKKFSDWLIQIMMTGNLEAIFPAATREYSPLVEELWKDKAFRATYNRRNELNTIPGVANYFLDRAIEISRSNYEPSEMDILYAEGMSSSNGIASMEFSFPKSSQNGYMESLDHDAPLARYQLIRAHESSLGQNCKWLEMFEDIDLVLYCVSLTSYDEFYEDSNMILTNKMLASRKLFESMVTHPTFAGKEFLLILNKFDLLEKKIGQVPLNQCDWFQDFNPVLSNHPNNSSSLPESAFHYIAVKFKRLFGSLTGRNLYVAPVTGLEADSVDEALKYAREILKWHEEKPTICTQEWSSGSIEASTTS